MVFTNVQKPRCFVVYAIAPESLSAIGANTAINSYTAESSRGLVLFHDHFIGQRGGMMVVFVETDLQRAALRDLGPLKGWDVKIHPLIFAHSPAAFDEQIAYTLRAYHQTDWEALQNEKRPHYGNPVLEAETASESGD